MIFNSCYWIIVNCYLLYVTCFMRLSFFLKLAITCKNLFPFAHCCTSHNFLSIYVHTSVTLFVHAFCLSPPVCPLPPLFVFIPLLVCAFCFSENSSIISNQINFTTAWWSLVGLGCLPTAIEL